MTRRSATIGVLTSGSALFGPTSTLIAVEVAARDHGLFTSVATVQDWDAEATSSALEHFMQQGVDGAVVIAAQDDAIEAVTSFAAPVPVVVIGAPAAPAGRVHSVTVDHEAGARAAVRHLLELGHTDVAHLAGPQDWLEGRARLRGWQLELAAAGLPVPEAIPGDWTADHGYRVGLRLVADGLPSAVFAANDQLALGLVHAFVEAGVRVPQDVSVVGFDDVDGSAHFSPPLTTVRQEFEALGRRCVQMLLAAIEGEQVEAQMIEPHLVVRSSSAAPRATEA